MKERELRDHVACSFCGRQLGKTRLPLFWTVSVRRYGLNLPAIQRQSGLATFLGGNALVAAALGPDDEMADPLTDVIELTMCEKCAMAPTTQGVGLVALAKAERERDKA